MNRITEDGIYIICSILGGVLGAFLVLLLIALLEKYVNGY